MNPPAMPTSVPGQQCFRCVENEDPNEVYENSCMVGESPAKASKAVTIGLKFPGCFLFIGNALIII
jgi:hypothetical protein